MVPFLLKYLLLAVMGFKAAQGFERHHDVGGGVHPAQVGGVGNGQ